MSALPKGVRISRKQLSSSVLGHLAQSLWWWPGMAKRLHAWRGVRFSCRDGVFLGRGVLLDNRCPDLISIGDDVWLTAGVVVLAHSYASRMQGIRFGLTEKTAPVTIEDGVFVGVNSIILPGVRLGAGCYVAAGSVVVADVPPGVLAAGSPARVIRCLDS
jgi:maltose O-acetyltransferase